MWLQNKSVTEQAEDAFQAQAQQVKETVVDPLAEGTPATAPENAWWVSDARKGMAVDLDGDVRSRSRDH